MIDLVRRAHPRTIFAIIGALIAIVLAVVALVLIPRGDSDIPEGGLVVAGTPITAEQIEAQVELNAPSDEDVAAAGAEIYIRDGAVVALVREELVRRDAARMGITVSDAELERALAPYEENGQTPSAEERQQAESSLLQRKVQEHLVAETPAKITEADLRRAWDVRRDSLTREAGRNVGIIRAKSRQSAARAVAALKAGEQFAAVNERYRSDPSDSGFAGISPVSTPELWEVTKGVATGTVIGPIRAGDHWVAIQPTEDIQPAVAPTYAQARAEIKAQLEAEHASALYGQWLNGLIERYAGEIEDPQGLVPPPSDGPSFSGPLAP